MAAGKLSRQIKRDMLMARCPIPEIHAALKDGEKGVSGWIAAAIRLQISEGAASAEVIAKDAGGQGGVSSNTAPPTADEVSFGEYHSLPTSSVLGGEGDPQVHAAETLGAAAGESGGCNGVSLFFQGASAGGDTLGADTETAPASQHEIGGAKDIAGLGVLSPTSLCGSPAQPSPSECRSVRARA